MTEVSVGELFIRLVISLGVVVGIMAAAAWVLKRANSGTLFGGTGRSGRPVRIEVLARQQLGRRSSIAIVRTGGRGLVLGVTDQQVTLLTETDADDLIIEEPPRTVSLVDDAGGPASDTSPWKSLAEALRDRTVRR